jgi:hypothetical protein
LFGEYKLKNYILAFWHAVLLFLRAETSSLLECAGSWEIFEVLMIMDQPLRGLYASVNELKLN